MTPALLTKSEAAAHARVSIRSLENHVRRGTGPITTRIGGKVFIREDHLTEWLERCVGLPAPATEPKRKSSVLGHPADAA